LPQVVVDSNVLVKWFIPEDFHENAKALLRDHLLGRVTAVAPRYALLEFANTVRKYVARRILSSDLAQRAFSLLVESSPRLVDESPDLVRRALNYAMENGVTVYDAYYIVIARELNTTAYTADERLLRRLRGREDAIAHISEYEPLSK